MSKIQIILNTSNPWALVSGIQYTDWLSKLGPVEE